MMREELDHIRQNLYRVAVDDGDIAAGALWIAAEEYPGLEVATYLAFLDRLAETVRNRARRTKRPEWRRALTSELFVKQHFVGSSDDYYDPRNSYLNEVIDRRQGLPITLAIIYLAVGTRLGLEVAGVNAPGHFLVRHGSSILDPFNRGRRITQAQLISQLEEMKAPSPQAYVKYLLASPPSTRAILCRLLANLKANYLHRGDLTRALAVVDRLVHLSPDNPAELRDRGAIYQRLDCPHAALADLRRYLSLAPDDPEADVIRTTIVQLSATGGSLH